MALKLPTVKNKITNTLFLILTSQGRHIGHILLPGGFKVSGEIWYLC